MNNFYCEFVDNEKKTSLRMRLRMLEQHADRVTQGRPDAYCLAVYTNNIIVVFENEDEHRTFERTLPTSSKEARKLRNSDLASGNATLGPVGRRTRYGLEV